MYKFTLTYNENSVNNSGLYNILYDKKLIHKEVEFPYNILFKEYKSFYQVEVIRVSCGTKKVYNLNNISTTTFNIPNSPKVPVIYVPPTTTQYVSTTEAPITTTIQPTTLNLVYSIDDCYVSNGVKFVNVSYIIDGYHHNAVKLEVRTLDGTLYHTSDKLRGTLILRRGAYLFVVKDTQTNQVIQSITTPILNCPMPNFVVSYIPNTLGINDAKLDIKNIVNTSRFRYCSGSTFICDNSFDSPDYFVKVGETSVIIDTNNGVDGNYVSGEFITVRGFGLVEDEYLDYTVSVTPAVPLGNDKDIKVVTLAYDLGERLEIKTYLVKNGKKYIAPTDVTSTYNYSVYDTSNNPSVPQTGSITILKSTSETVEYVSKQVDSSVVYFCVENVYPQEFNTIKFINNNPC